MLAATDDEMVVDADTERLGGGDDVFSQADISLAGGGIAGRMIVHEDDCAGAQIQRPPHNLTRIGSGVIDGATMLNFIAHQLVFVVEEQ